MKGIVYLILNLQSFVLGTPFLLWEHRLKQNCFKISFPVQRSIIWVTLVITADKWLQLYRGMVKTSNSISACMAKKLLSSFGLEIFCKTLGLFQVPCFRNSSHCFCSVPVCISSWDHSLPWCAQCLLFVSFWHNLNIPRPSKLPLEGASGSKSPHYVSLSHQVSSCLEWAASDVPTHRSCLAGQGSQRTQDRRKHLYEGKIKQSQPSQKQAHVFPVHERHFALSMCLLVICTSLFEKCLFHSFASFIVRSRHFWFFSFLVWILIPCQMRTLLRFFPSLQSVFSTCFFCCAKAFKYSAIPFGNLFHYFLSYCWSV